ncbi:regulatory protein RecX [Chloroflexota bacterium]
MGKITALRTGKGRAKRVNVFLDGKFAFSLEAEVAVKEGLRLGQEIASSRTETLLKSDQRHHCFNAAARYLSYRPRSEFELRERLRRRGFTDDSITAVLDKLKEQGLMDDTKFAQFWKDNRETFSPRSQWLTRLELRRKGVAEDIIEQTTDAIDDDNSAYLLALSKARNLPLSDRQVFRRRLGDYLKRRGFGYGVINDTAERVWQELRE